MKKKRLELNKKLNQQTLIYAILHFKCMKFSKYEILKGSMSKFFFSSNSSKKLCLVVQKTKKRLF